MKMLSVLLALVMLMTAAPFTAQTETADAAFALIADKEYVMPGGEVTVTVRLTEGAISSGEFYVDYDKSVFSTNPSTDVIGPGISDMSVSAANIGNDGVRCNLAFTYPYYHRQDATTDIFTVKLTIHEEAVMGSEYEIALRAESLTCAKSNSDPTIELIDASFEPATVKVIVGDESAIGECTWELDGTVLTIKGEGAMKDFASASEVPWPTSITEVIIEEGVTNIGANAFLNCASLISATIPKSVTDIGYRAFFFCSNLATITLPDGVTNIGEDAFRACASLTSVTIPDSVTSIGMWAFSYCISLTSVTLGDSGIKIGNSAFYDCTDLTDVWCQGYESNKSKIEIASGNECLTSATWYYYKEGYSYDYRIEDGEATITGVKGKLSSDLEIPSTLEDCPVTGIGSDAFKDFAGLTSITIPASVTRIEDSAFYGCTSLTDVWYQGSKIDKAKIVVGLGNECLTLATWHYNTSASEVTSPKYAIANNKISKIPEGTTVEDLLAGINAGAVCRVCQGDTLLSNDVLVATGMVVQVMDGEAVKDSYAIVVAGDINGDSSMNAADALKVLQHAVKLVSLNDEFFDAADVNQDEKVDAADALRILQYAVKLIDGFFVVEEIPPVEETPFIPGTPPSSQPDVPPSSQPDVVNPMQNEYTLVVQAADDESDLLQAVAEFQQKYSNVKIRLQRGDNGRSTSLDQLKMQLASNNAPDVVIMDSVYAAAAGYDGDLLDLQQFGSEDVREQFVPSCWESVKSQLAGSTAQFGLPFDCNTILMFYNKTLLDKAGIGKVPETWSKFTQALDLLRSVPGVTTPFHLMVNFDATQGQKNYMAFQWMMYLWRLGGDVLTPDLKQAAFQGDEGVQALQLYVDMVTKYGVSRAAYGTGDPFGTGAAGFDMMTNNLYKAYMENPARTDTYGVTMLPELKAGVPRYSGLGLYAVALPNKISGTKGDALVKATETAKWAYEFAEHYTTGLDYQLEYGRTAYLMPSLKAGEGRGVFQGEYWNMAYRQLETSKFRSGVKSLDSIESEIAQAINDAVNNVRSPQEALQIAAKKANRQLS